MVIFSVQLMMNQKFLEIPKKDWDQALKNIVPDFSWLRLGFFSKKASILTYTHHL
jgi:hypothetical protein